MITAYSRGHQIEYVNGEWVYSDNKMHINETRPCARCGKSPTPEGYDHCIGHIAGAVSACCGHGVETGYIMYEDGSVCDI